MSHITKIRNALKDESRFVRLILSGSPGKAEWRKVVVRPVRLAAGRALQAVLRGEHKEHTQNISPADIETRLDELLAMGFRNIHVQSTDEDLHIRITKKGKALVSVGKPSAMEAPAERAHDREKQYPLPASRPDEFLETAGVMRNGTVRAAMRDKFRQINHFLELLSHTKVIRERRPGRLHILDCGCGRALLTFAACHYLRDSLGLSVSVVGVDSNEEVIASAEGLRNRLGEKDVELVRARILNYEPAVAPNVVLSLHACDTATDEALAQGVRRGADLILAAPCCQHELHCQIGRPEFRAALRHGVLRERTADILTDALRAAALRVMGYKAEVIEFISSDHTAKNLMIRAQKARGIPRKAAVREYLALRDFWAVAPAVEELLGDEFARSLRH